MFSWALIQFHFKFCYEYISFFSIIHPSELWPTPRGQINFKLKINSLLCRMYRGKKYFFSQMLFYNWGISIFKEIMLFFAAALNVQGTSPSASRYYFPVHFLIKKLPSWMTIFSYYTSVPFYVISRSLLRFLTFLIARSWTCYR